MKLIIGLGNPGEKYENNRHNVGYLLVDSLLKNKSQDTKVVKTNVFMNESGIVVKKLIKDYNLPTENLYVAHDDLDLPLGEYKIQFGRGPKLHKGILSIEGELGTTDFWRIRIGVDNRDPDDRIPGEEYVLQDFTGEEKEKVDQVIQRLIHEKLL